MISEAELAAMEKRCNAATPGPWTADTQLGIDEPDSADSLFILRARTDMPRLIEEVRRLTWELEHRPDPR